MANTDPVSGLYASLSRVRRRGPEGGYAAQAGTASQAGTVQPAPPALQPMPMPPMPKPQLQAQSQQAPVPNPLMSLQQAQPELPTPVAPNAPQTASTAPISPDDLEVVRLSTLFRRIVPGFTEDVALALAAQYLEESGQQMPNQPGQTLL